MPIQLTTPFDPGDFDSTTYTQAKIVAYSVDILAKRIILICQYGNTVDGVWVPGKNSNKNVAIQDGPSDVIPQVTDFTDFVTNTKFSGTDVIVYAIVQQALYNWLIDHDIFAGTIV